MTRMSAKEYQEMLRREASRKGSKYRNIKIYVYADGFIANTNNLKNHGAVVEKYDSKKEYTRYKELILLERTGKISSLQRQVPFLLKDAFINSKGKKCMAITYVADFVYFEGNCRVIEDVKGINYRTGKVRKTADFSLKWKMLQDLYPEYDCRIY